MDRLDIAAQDLPVEEYRERAAFQSVRKGYRLRHGQASFVSITAMQARVAIEGTGGRYCCEQGRTQARWRDNGLRSTRADTGPAR